MRWKRSPTEFGDKIVLGAGTVLDPETARTCMLAGAEFFVTPSLNASHHPDGEALLEGDLPGRPHPHRGADRVGGRRRYRQGLPLRERGRTQVHQGA